MTGIGMVTPLAANARATWKKIIGGSSGVRRLDSLKGLPTELAAPVPRISSDTGAAVDDDAFDPSKCRLIERGDDMSIAPFAQFALAAAAEALDDAKWSPQTDDERLRTGVAGPVRGGGQTVSRVSRARAACGARVSGAAAAAWGRSDARRAAWGAAGNGGGIRGLSLYMMVSYCTMHHAGPWSWSVVMVSEKCFLTGGAEAGWRSFERPGVDFKWLLRGFDLLDLELGGRGSATK